MENISKVEENLVIKTDLQKGDIKFYDVEDTPFKVYGIFRENGKYRRMPESIAQKVNVGVIKRHTNTAGGRVRFVTDSNYVIIHVEMDGIERWPHFTYAGYMGFDLYVGRQYKGTFVPPADMESGYENIIEFETNDKREITINFPLYSNVKKLHIGLQKSAVVEGTAPYVNIKPIVFYGSSITQGGCASRPGMCYQAIISRKFNCDYINLGFSGYALAEEEMIDYIKKLDMSIFVYDYDHNAPTVKHLRNTHEKMFKAIRNENPDIPIIMMSRPKYNPTKDEKERLHIIETTYKNAVLAGDKNVYFIDGKTLMELCEDEGTVDGCHPTDFGFVSIAKAVGDVIQRNNLLKLSI